MKKTLLILFIFAAFASGCSTIYAHGIDLEDAYLTLGVEKPTLLPDSPFYFLKSMGRGIKIFFTFDPVKKAERELEFADEKLAELATLTTKNVEKNALDEALQNYLDAHERLQKRLESLRGKNKNVDLLLGRLAERVLDHKELFDELEDEFKEEDLEKIEKELAEEVKEALKLDEKKFKEKLKEKAKEDKEKFKEFFDDLEEELEDLADEIKESVVEELDIELEDLNNFDENLGEELEDITEELEKDDTSSKERILKECGPMPGAPGNWVCENGGWVLKEWPRHGLCIQLYDPVCGVDGKTYSNDCFAKVAGVQIKQRGECAARTTSPTPQPTPPPPAAAPSEPTQEFKIEADDYGFYPNSIEVTKGVKVKIAFLVRNTNVYYGGLDFRSTRFQTVKAPPGGTATVEFTAYEPFGITSYWPTSSAKKADMKVEVK